MPDDTSGSSSDYTRGTPSVGTNPTTGELTIYFNPPPGSSGPTISVGLGGGGVTTGRMGGQPGAPSSQSSIGGGQQPPKEQPKPITDINKNPPKPPEVPDIKPDKSAEIAYGAQAAITYSTGIEYAEVEQEKKGYKISLKTKEQREAYDTLLQNALKEQALKEYGARVKKIAPGVYEVTRSQQEQSSLETYLEQAKYSAPGSKEEQTGVWGLKAMGYQAPTKATSDELKQFKSYMDSLTKPSQPETIKNMPQTPTEPSDYERWQSLLREDLMTGRSYQPQPVYNAPRYEGPIAEAARMGYDVRAVPLPKATKDVNIYSAFGGAAAFEKQLAVSPKNENLANFLSETSYIAQHGIGIKETFEQYAKTLVGGYNEREFSYDIPHSTKELAYWGIVGPPTVFEQLVIQTPSSIPSALYVTTQRPSTAAGVAMYSTAFAIKETAETPLSPQKTIQFIATIPAFYSYGKVIKNLPKYESFDLTTDTGKITYRAITVTEASHPLLGSTPRGLELGMPTIEFAGIKSQYSGSVALLPKGIKFPGLVSETRTLASYPESELMNKFLMRKEVLDELGISEMDRLQLRIQYETTKALQDVGSKYVTNFIRETKEAPEPAVSIALETARGYDVRVYGSFAAKAQVLPELYGTYVPGDIELSVKTTAKASKLAQEEAAKLTASGFKGGNEPPSLSVTISEGKKFLDIHSEEEALYSYSGRSIGLRYGLEEYKGDINIEGFRTQPLGENLVRMFGSSAGWHTTTEGVGIKYGLSAIDPLYLKISEYVTTKGGAVGGSASLTAAGFKSTRGSFKFDLDVDIPKDTPTIRKEIVKGVYDIVKSEFAGRGGTDVRIKVSEPDLFAKAPQKNIVGLEWESGAVDIAFGETFTKSIIVGKTRFRLVEDILADKKEILSEHTTKGIINPDEIGKQWVQRKVYKATHDIPVIEDMLSIDRRVSIEPLGGAARSKDVLKYYVYGRSLLESAGFSEQKYGLYRANLELLRNPELYETLEAKEILKELDANIKLLGDRGIGKTLEAHPDIERGIMEDVTASERAANAKKPKYPPPQISKGDYASVISKGVSQNISGKSSSLSSQFSNVSSALSKSLKSLGSPTSSKSLKSSPNFPSFSLTSSPSVPRSPSISTSISPSRSVSRAMSPSIPTSPSASVSPSASMSSLSSWFNPSLPPIPPAVSRGYSESKSVKKRKAGYYALLKRFGKFGVISPSLELEQAMFVGQSKALETLGATFKLIPSGIEATESNLPRISAPGKMFRGYKIRHGIRIPTNLEWIQKRGTRLSTQGEVSEIQTARRNKPKNKKGGRYGFDFP